MSNNKKSMEAVYLFSPMAHDRETAQMMADEIAKEFEEDVNLMFIKN